MIYFIQCGQDGPVKIGFTVKSAESRLALLQTGNHQTLTILRVMRGGYRLERWLHVRFRDVRIRSEWFAFHPDMLTVKAPPSLNAMDDVTGRRAETKPRQRGLTDDQVRAIRSDTRDSRIVADEYGVSRLTIYNVRARRRKALVAD